MGDDVGVEKKSCQLDLVLRYMIFERAIQRGRDVSRSWRSWWKSHASSEKQTVCCLFVLGRGGKVGHSVVGIDGVIKGKANESGNGGGARTPSSIRAEP